MKLYHIPPEKMVGTKLVPLTTLQRIVPELAKQSIAKYRGREDVAAILIPCLSCTWLDVIHMFAVSPKLIQERQRLLGGPPLQFYEIVSDSLDINFLGVYYRDDEETGNMIFESFNTSIPLDRPDEEHEKWFHEEIAAGRRLPLFAGIPHILYKGEIDISDCPIVS